MKNELQHLAPAQLIALVRFCAAAMGILNARLFTLVGLLLCAGGFAWALYAPTWERVTAAVAFAILGYWPLIRIELKASTPQSTQGEQHD